MTAAIEFEDHNGIFADKLAISRGENPYLDAYHRACAAGERDMFGIPANVRNPLVKRYAWAIPSRGAIAALVELSPILEIGAGGGYWAAMIEAAGGKVDCFDAFEPGWGDADDNHFGRWHPVHKGDHSIAGWDHYHDHTLLLCWPNYASSFALDAVAAFRGQRVAYVGESRGGCNGCDAFHYAMGFWQNDPLIPIPQWKGLHDNLTVFRRPA